MAGRLCMSLCAAAALGILAAGCEGTEGLGGSGPALPCATQMANIDGIWAYSNGDDQGTERSCGSTNSEYGYQYQCVEYVQRYMAQIFSSSRHRWGANATGLCDVLPPGFTKHTLGDGYSPLHGDAVVLNIGPVGHTAIIDTNNDGDIQVVEQNNDPTGRNSYPTRLVKCYIHADNYFSVFPPDPPPVPPALPGLPNTGWTWNCADSRLKSNGQQYWTCNDKDGDLYECQGDTPKPQQCQHGCFHNRLGQDDLCIETAPVWNCLNSRLRSNGQQYWTCDKDGHLYCCDPAGTPETVLCPNGCHDNGFGHDDTCN